MCDYLRVIIYIYIYIYIYNTRVLKIGDLLTISRFCRDPVRYYFVNHQNAQSRVPRGATGLTHSRTDKAWGKKETISFNSFLSLTSGLPVQKKSTSERFIV